MRSKWKEEVREREQEKAVGIAGVEAPPEDWGDIMKAQNVAKGRSLQWPLDRYELECEDMGIISHG